MNKKENAIRRYRQRAWRLPKNIHDRIDKAVKKQEKSENSWAIDFLDKRLPI